MQKPDFKPEYDVVVIGAGVGGLTAAALLSKAGYSVCVLEKEPHAGGYLAGFRRKNFRFDTAIHWLNQCSPGGMAATIFDFLGADHPEAIPQKRIRRYKGDTFDYLLTNNPDEFRDQLITEYPHEKDGIIRFFKAAKKLGYSFKNFGSVLPHTCSQHLDAQTQPRRQICVSKFGDIGWSALWGGIHGKLGHLA